MKNVDEFDTFWKKHKQKIGELDDATRDKIQEYRRIVSKQQYVKLFKQSNIEQEINKWLENNCNKITVVDIKYTTENISDRLIFYSAMIIYTYK